MATSRKNWLSVRCHHLLCDTDVALKCRLRLLTSCVLSSMYLCAGSWILSFTQCVHLRAVSDRMLRNMICVPRLPNEKVHNLT